MSKRVRGKGRIRECTLIERVQCSKCKKFFQRIDFDKHTCYHIYRVGHYPILMDPSGMGIVRHYLVVGENFEKIEAERDLTS